MPEYDSVHSEKGTIKKLSVCDLPYWKNILDAMTISDKKNNLLNKENFTDNYSAIVLVYEKLIGEEIQKIYLVAQYRKIDSWYKRSVKFGFVANTIKFKDEEIFALNGCIDTVIVGPDVYVLQETAFEKVFNYYEKSKKLVFEKKDEIESWDFIDDAKAFYEDVFSKKGAVTKLAHALEKSTFDFSKLNPSDVKSTLSQYDEFGALSYDDNDKIKFTSSVRDLIIDIVRHSYTRNLFSENLVHTKGI